MHSSKMTSPKVSVCIPVYGVEKFIERCVRSLFEQTYENIEYVFVDDCSPDKSIEIIKSVLEEYPHRKHQVKIVRHNHNRGIAAVRNTFVSVAEGEFIMQIDSDDYVEKDLVKRCVDVQQKSDADIVSPSFDMRHCRSCRTVMAIVNDNRIKQCESLIKKKIPPVIWGRLIRKSLYTANGISCLEGCNMGEDWQLISRLFYFAKRTAVSLPVSYHYSVSEDPNSYTASFSESKSQQAFGSLGVLIDFFKDKELILYQSTLQTYAKMLAETLFNCLRYNKTGDYYKKIRKQLKEVESQYYPNIPIVYKPIIIIENLHMCRLYVKMCMLVYKGIRKIR